MTAATKPPLATTEFAWEEPPAPRGDIYETRWFPAEYRARLDSAPGKWARIAAGAGPHLITELRKRFDGYEFTKTREAVEGRSYTIYARRAVAQ